MNQRFLLLVQRNGSYRHTDYVFYRHLFAVYHAVFPYKLNVFDQSCGTNVLQKGGGIRKRLTLSYASC